MATNNTGLTGGLWKTGNTTCNISSQYTMQDTDLNVKVNVKVSGDLYIEGSLKCTGIPDDAVDLIEEVLLMRKILLENDEFRELYDQEKLVKKLRGTD